MTEGSEVKNMFIDFIDKETTGGFSKSFVGWMTQEEIKLLLINFCQWSIVKEMRVNSQCQQNT